MSKAYLILLLAILPCLALAWSPRCPAKVQARDGSTYSLKNIEGILLSSSFLNLEKKQSVFVNISICNNMADPCGGNNCAQPNTAAVCASETPFNGGSSAEECYGSFDQKTKVTGFDGNAGISITYYDGDQFSPGQNYSTQLMLGCDVTLAHTAIEVDNVKPSEGTLEIQGRMYCPTSALPWIETNTHYKDPNCNSFNVYLVSRNNVAKCTPGCLPGSEGDTSIEVTCERVSKTPF